jgi:hypothetical protein
VASRVKAIAIAGSVALGLTVAGAAAADVTSTSVHRAPVVRHAAAPVAAPAPPVAPAAPATTTAPPAPVAAPVAAVPTPSPAPIESPQSAPAPTLPAVVPAPVVPAPPPTTTTTTAPQWNVETFIDCPGQPGQASNYTGSQAQAQAIYDQWTANLGQPYAADPGCTYGSATVPEPVNNNGTLAG